MAPGASPDARNLDRTPTWAVAAVCASIIIISLLLEKGLHHVGGWLIKKQKRTLYEVLEKVKAELMILGFISLLLTFSQDQIAKICVPQGVADSMLPCSLDDTEEEESTGGNKRRLLTLLLTESHLKRRILAAGGSAVECASGKAPLITTTGLHQLHILIFFLAVFHVLNTALIMVLGRAKIHRWKDWEKDTTSAEYAFTNDPSRFRFADEVSFVMSHTSFWNRNVILFYIKCFFNQFFKSVSKADYLTLRHGFISAHLAPGTSFNFKRYIKRALEDDFKQVVEISYILWASAVIILLLNVHGWQELFWASIIPLVIILAVGMKLQAIMEGMAMEIKDRQTVVQGIPLVHLTDQHFWFGRPQFVLFLIRLALFLNGFQITYFFWIWYQFGLRSCFHETFFFIIARIVIGVIGQVLCSYITLPLYALVSQMGSHMKRSIFDDQTSRALKRWHQNVKKKLKGTPPRSVAPSPRSSANSSPVHPVQFKSMRHAGETHYRSPRRHLPEPGNSEVHISEQDNTDQEDEISILPINQVTDERDFEPLELQMEAGEQHNREDHSFSFVNTRGPSLKQP
ncbi:MLO-like protein 9 [Curcuma longa]|uniref:MLO-like protein 9 n=1 Tax=Curcuma longa TaxID=136217 RepID=UPI003D9F5F9F